MAVLVPAWREADVIGHMVQHSLSAWRQREFTIYVGCYANDPATVAAVIAGANGDPRVRVVVHDRFGPTTKADCLNRLYAAMEEDERRTGWRFRGVVLHDSEDMVHPAALVAIDRALAESDFIQLPVLPVPQTESPWIAGHYTDEFAEAHAKTLVVRNALGAAIPAAGVGCGFGREMLARLAARRIAEGENGPFASDCLTEDYELGLLVSRLGGRSRFLRMRDRYGNLVATRSYFPSTLQAAVRQKSRWIHGISLQSWDRLGWSGRPIDLWMALRDRKGPLTALVFFLGYALFLVEIPLTAARLAGWYQPPALPPMLHVMMGICLAGFIWRAVCRMTFTAREHGFIEGLRALARMPVANVIAIMAGRRAVSSYVRSLLSGTVRWEKTDHAIHPAAREALL